MREIKIANGVLGRANQLKIARPIFVFHYLKGINHTGYFTCKQLVESVQQSLSCHESTARKHISSLVKLRLLSRTTNGFTIVSYDCMYDVLGFDLTYNRKRKRNGKFAIYKRQISNEKQFRAHCAVLDISIDLNAQFKKIRTEEYKRNVGRHLSQKQRCSCTENLYRKINTVPTKEYLEVVQHNKYSSLSNHTVEQLTNYDITLSCKGVATLLGYSSVTSGYQIEKLLKEMGLLEVERRFISLGSTELSYQSFRHLYPCKSYHYIDGFILKQISNKLTLLA